MKCSWYLGLKCLLDWAVAEGQELRRDLRLSAIDAAGFPTNTGWGRLIDRTYDERCPLYGVDRDITTSAVRQFAAEVWGITPKTIRDRRAA